MSFLEEKLPSVKTYSPEEIAKKHGVSTNKINQQLRLGIEVEKEHTRDIKMAREIALDHLLELPDYYDRLSDMEDEGGVKEADVSHNNPTPDVGRHQAIRILNPWIRNPQSLDADDLFVQIEKRVLPQMSPRGPASRNPEYVKAAFKTLTGHDYNEFTKGWTRTQGELRRTKEGSFDDAMPRKTRQIDRAKQLNMRTGDEIMHTTMSDVDPGPGMYQEDAGTDPNSFEQIANIKRARRSRALSRKDNRVHECAECGCGAAVAPEAPQAGLLTLEPQGGITYAPTSEEGEDYALDETWFADATQELLDRSSTGEDWIKIVNDLARRFAEYFDGSYTAFDFAADAFGRRAWEMGLVETQIMMANFDITEDFFPDDPLLPPGHRPVEVTGNEFDQFVKRGKLEKQAASGTEPFDWYVDERGTAWAAANEHDRGGSYYIWKPEAKEAVFGSHKIKLERTGPVRELAIYIRPKKMGKIRFG